MTNFDRNIADLGTVKQYTTVEAEYKVVSDRIVKSVSPSCGCTIAFFTDKSITLKYKAGSVPVHLGSHYLSTKFAVVKFSDGTVEKIYLNVTIIKG